MSPSQKLAISLPNGVAKSPPYPPVLLACQKPPLRLRLFGTPKATPPTPSQGALAMIATEAQLEKYAQLVEDTDEYGDFEEWSPKPGLSLLQAVEVSYWCANRNVGRRQRCVELWFEVFHRCMTEAGYDRKSVV